MKGALGLPVCFDGLLVAGLPFLAADSLRLPYLEMLKAVINTGRENRKTARSLGTYLLSLAVKLASCIHMDEYRRGRQKNILRTSGLSMEPEVYQAYVISKVGPVLLGIAPCPLVLPLLAMIAAVPAVMVYFKEQERTDELLAKKGGELEGELSRFMSTIKQELKSSRDVLSIVESYKKSTRGGFANELETLAADMRSSSYEAALTRFEARINSPMLSNVVKGLAGVLRGDDGVMYFQMLSHDFKQMELQRLKKETQKIPPKIRVFSFFMLVCFTIIYLAIIVFETLKSMGSVFWKRKRRRCKDTSSVKSQTGMAEKEVENGSGQKLSGVVREFLERHPKEPVFMMMPGRCVHLVPEQIGNLLAGGVVSGSLYGWRECVQIKVEELLQQMVGSVDHADDTWCVLTQLYKPEMIPTRTSEEGIVCHV